MGADLNLDWQAAAASAIDWWRDAGVDASIDEAPRDWLAPVEAPQPVARTARAAVAEAPVARPLPATLEAFEAWRTSAEAPETGWSGTPIAAQGPSSAEIMILTDMPERDDADSGMLMSGAVGRLFDRMLAAIGQDRSSVYLVPLCTVRPTAGRIAPEIEERLNEVVRHHVMLAAPKRLLLLGNAPSRASLGADAARIRGGIHVVNLSGGKMPQPINEVTVQAVASFHPRFLLERPAAKAEAWKDLQMLIAGLTK
jgi:uracil-DNA glycosylase family 4